jgi:hypothetical protein
MLEIGGRFLLGLPAVCTPQSQVRVLNKLAVSTFVGVICNAIIYVFNLFHVFKLMLSVACVL